MPSKVHKINTILQSQLLVIQILNFFIYLDEMIGRIYFPLCIKWARYGRL